MAHLHTGSPVSGRVGSSRPRILIIGARGIGGSEGGVEKFAEEFGRRICHECQVTFISLHDRKPADLDEVELVVAPRSRALRTDKLYYYLLAARTCLTRRFDYIMLLGLNSAMLLLPLRLLFWRRTKLVVRSGSIDYLLSKWGLPSKLYFRVAERLLPLADLVVAVAPNIHRHLARRGIRAVLIPNGLTRTPVRTPPVRGRRQILAVGRVTMQKNYELLVEAARLLRDRDVSISIVGGADLSPERKRLDALMERLGVDNLTFLGALPREEAIERIATASLLVNCSIHEGMSNSVLEAIQQATPVILSDIEANRDLDLPDSFYFDPRSGSDLAAHIEAALEEPSRFVADPARFSSWDEVVEVYRGQMHLPHGAYEPAAPRRKLVAASQSGEI